MLTSAPVTCIVLKVRCELWLSSVIPNPLPIVLSVTKSKFASNNYQQLSHLPATTINNYLICQQQLSTSRSYHILPATTINLRTGLKRQCSYHGKFATFSTNSALFSSSLPFKMKLLWSCSQSLNCQFFAKDRGQARKSYTHVLAPGSYQILIIVSEDCVCCRSILWCQLIISYTK